MDKSRGPRPPRQSDPARAARSSKEPGARSKPSRGSAHLSDQIVRELQASARPGKGELLVKIFGEAVGAYMEGDLDDALRLGEGAKQLALRSVNVREFLGLTYYAAERWKEASRELAAFRRMTGSTAQNHVIADCYRATGKPDKALEYCDEISQRDVGEDVYFEGQIVAAGALADMDRLDEGIGRILRLELDPQVAEEHHLRAWYVLGDLLERRGKFTQARRWFDAVATADPGLTDADDRSERLADPQD